MLNRFWEAIGTKLADRWFAVSIPALLFWIGGLLAWAYSSGGGFAGAAVEWLSGQSPVGQIAALAGALLAVLASGELVAALAGPALRLLEGYWPRLLEPLRSVMVGGVARRVAELEDHFQALVGPVEEGRASPAERAEFVRLDRQLRRVPSNGDYLPTSVGNTLRAAETRPGDKYGLDAITVWPHLWLLLPSGAQAELTAARRSLDTAVVNLLWGLLFTAFTPLAWWAAPVGLGVAFLAYRFSLRSRAEVFADLVEAVFDLYRGTLYRQLRWPLPSNPAAEPASGRRLTTYLWRGLDEAEPTFTVPNEK